MSDSKSKIDLTKKRRATSSSSSESYNHQLMRPTKTSKAKIKAPLGTSQLSLQQTRSKSKSQSKKKETKSLSSQRKIKKQDQIKEKKSSSRKDSEKKDSDRSLLRKKLDDYNKELQELKNKIYQEQQQKDHSRLIQQSVQEDKETIAQLQEQNEQLRNNQLKLLEELQRQSEISKDALNKLYVYQQENVEERERMKQYYQEYYELRNKDIVEKYEIKVEVLEQRLQQLHSAQMCHQSVSYEQEDIIKKLTEQFQQKEAQYLREISLLKSQVLSQQKPYQTYTTPEFVSSLKTYQSQNSPDLEASKNLEKQNIFILRQELANLKEKESSQNKLISELELKIQKLMKQNNKMIDNEKENDRLLARIHQLEKQLHRKKQKIDELKEIQKSQFVELNSEIKALINVLDKV